MRFSKQTGCFYPEDINYADLPGDIISVPEEDFASPMSRQSGDTLDVIDGRVVIVPAPEPALEELQAQAWANIKSERDRRLIGGVFVSTGKDAGKWFQSDDSSQIKLNALFSLGANIPKGVVWKTLDNTFIEMTQSLCQAVMISSLSAQNAIFQVAESHKSAMEKSKSPLEYDYSAGWPKIYGE